ncbi:hypothetical protein [Streptomyces sp. Ru87]|uniref:hypothetical protein n=1 Tax=Streptomyces sp. Ru87 TaxID=2044307 RepID=UPI000BF27E69|nr:hypothetical protein [Streptomyces sp. Ru87]PGH49932.1 hypothetical protein CRI70_14795 [Streptomyces sp. Ru87]
MDQNPVSVPAERVAILDERGRPYAYVREVECPYCLAVHRHGDRLGHRVTHCHDIPASRPKVDPRDVKRNAGYVLCEPTDDVDWEAERLRARIPVLLNTYRRLRSEVAGPEPTSARALKVRAATRQQLRQVEGILRAAGVIK